MDNQGTYDSMSNITPEKAIHPTVDKDGIAVVSVTTSKSPEDREDKPWLMKIFLSWYMLLAHLLICIAIAVSMIFALNGYQALNGSGRRRTGNGKYVLQSSDILRLISVGLTVVDFLVSSCAGAVMWRCLFASLETDGLTLKQFNWLVSSGLPPWIRPKSRTAGAVGLALLMVIPLSFLDPLLNGALNFQASTAAGQSVPTASGNPDADFWLWNWYHLHDGDRKAAVRQAAGMAGLAWGNGNNGMTQNETEPGSTGSTGGQRRCRHVVNNDNFPVNSTIHGLTIPCILIHDISWPTTEPSDLVKSVVQNSSQVSISGDEPFSYINYPGITVVLDPLDTVLKLPFSDSLNNEHLLQEIGLEKPTYPASFAFSGVLTAIVLISRTYIHSPHYVNPFGLTDLNNNITDTSDSLFDDLVYTYLNVNLTVGVMTPGLTTYTTSQVVEGEIDPEKAEIKPGPWVQEALYMLPDVMNMVSIMNNTSLDTWQNLENYVEALIRYSYLGAWDMLQRVYDPNTATFQALMAEPRLTAEVNSAMVYGWLGVCLLLTLAAIPVFYLESRHKSSTGIDWEAALLLTDPSQVPGGEEKELTGRLRLNEVSKGLKLFELTLGEKVN